MVESPPANPYEAPRADVDAIAPGPGPMQELADRWRRLGGALIDATLLGMAGVPGAIGRGATTIQCGANVGQRIPRRRVGGEHFQ